MFESPDSIFYVSAADFRAFAFFEIRPTPVIRHFYVEEDRCRRPGAAAGATVDEYNMRGISESSQAMPSASENRGESIPRLLAAASAPQLGG